MKKILSTQCKNKVHTSCDGYMEYFPHLKGYKCDCECHSVKKVKPTPPVNESWESELEEYGDLHGQYCGVNNEDECDCKELSDLKKFIRTLLSTARQEALSQARELVAKDRPMFIKNNIVSLIDSDHAIKIRKQLRKEILEDFDSLTSKGGV